MQRINTVKEKQKLAKGLQLNCVPPLQLHSLSFATLHVIVSQDPSPQEALLVITFPILGPDKPYNNNMC